MFNGARGDAVERGAGAIRFSPVSAVTMLQKRGVRRGPRKRMNGSGGPIQAPNAS